MCACVCMPLFIACWTHVCVVLRARMCSVRLWEYKSSVLTDSVVLLWCKKGSCLAEGEAIMAPLWIMRQECDPYLKVNVSGCPCRSPSQHCSLLRYRWWPWQHLIANNIHLIHPLMILTNFISLKTSENFLQLVRWFYFLPVQFVPEQETVPGKEADHSVSLSKIMSLSSWKFLTQGASDKKQLRLYHFTDGSLTF